jgi:hypothetical protein
VYNDLLEQAIGLARIDPKKPKQVNLRRAISSTYYAAFHLLVNEACRAQLGAHNQDAPFRRVLARAFSHSIMKEACKSFGGGTLKKSVGKGLPSGFAVPAEIRKSATTFVDLQEKRHLADYDLTERFRRSEVLAMIADVREDIDNFVNLAPSSEKQFFLACLWAWKELANR